MKRISIAALALFLCSGAHAADTKKRARTRHTAIPAKESTARSFSSIAASNDWTSWLKTHYPQPKGWSPDCEPAVSTTAGRGPDFLVEGDFNLTGVPSRIEVSTSPLPDQRFMIREFVLAECVEGKRREVLRVSVAAGIWVKGVEMKAYKVAGLRGYHADLATGTKASPGLQLSFAGADERDRPLTEGLDFFWIPRTKDYQIEGH